MKRSELKQIIKEEIRRVLKEESKDNLLNYIYGFASAYKVNISKLDILELINMFKNKSVSKEQLRKQFKKYFNIPMDADEDPNYVRDMSYDNKRIRTIFSNVEKTL